MDTSPRLSDLIRMVQLLWRRVCDAQLQSHGLSFSRFAVLRVVAEHPGVSVSRLAERSGMSKQAVHQALRGLRSGSMVNSAAVEGRGQAVQLTEVGRTLLETATDVVERVEQRMLAGLVVEERDELITVLRRCVENLETVQRIHRKPARAAQAHGPEPEGSGLATLKPGDGNGWPSAEWQGGPRDTAFVGLT